jgi:ATPase
VQSVLIVAGEALYVPDFSAIVQGSVSKLAKDGKISGRVVVHRLIVALLEAMSAKGYAVGYAGLEELKNLRKLHEQGELVVEYAGDRSRITLLNDLEQAVIEVNSAVRELALSTGGILITGDPVAYEVCRALGLKAMLVEKVKREKLAFEKYFDENTMSVHLKENAVQIGRAHV